MLTNPLLDILEARFGQLTKKGKRALANFGCMVLEWNLIMKTSEAE